MQIAGQRSPHSDSVDGWQAYELPLGSALAVWLAVHGQLIGKTWLALLVFAAVLGGAGWWAWQRQTKWHASAGRALLSFSAWLAPATATILVLGLVALMYSDGSTQLPRWEPWPMITGLWCGLYWLTLGAQANRAGHVYLGLWLCGTSGAWPGLPIGAGWQRDVVAAISLGGAIVLSSWLRQRKQRAA